MRQPIRSRRKRFVVLAGSSPAKTILWRCPTITASGRCPPPSREIHGSRVATRNIIGRRAMVRDRVFVGHGPCSSCLRIVSAEIAEQNAEAEKKTGMATSRAPVNTCSGRNSQECAPAQKPNKFFSAHSAPRSASSAFSVENIPAQTVPRFTSDCDNSCGTG